MPKKVLSLCMPTNGISEWVFPVLDSIYSQDIDLGLFEVVVTDNGDNAEFEKRMIEYAHKHTNLIYMKNNSQMFHNQLECIKLASGEYIKFINHRGVLVNGSLKKMIKIIEDNRGNKPTMFFSNGNLTGTEIYCSTFDEFIARLGRFVSWTTGVGIWKEEYDEIKDHLRVDNISPHSCILFSYRKKNSYIIYNYIYSEDIDKSHSKKGNYDLYKAFGVEEVAIIQNLFISGDITANTLKKVKKDYQHFVSELYWLFNVRKKPCSYYLNGFEDAMGIYFNRHIVVFGAYCYGIRNIIQKMVKKNGRR